MHKNSTMLFLKKNIRTQKKCEINNYFLNWISALVKEMGGNLFRNYEFDFSRVFWVRSSEKHKKYV